MKFARVIGTVVAERKYQGLEGVKLLVVQRLDTDADTGESCRPVHGELN